jgi:hypothetical protein
MLISTALNLFFTPLLFVVVDRVRSYERSSLAKHAGDTAEAAK